MTTDRKDWSSQRTIDILQSAQEGEAAAREELFTRYSGRVLDIVRIRLGTRMRKSLESGDILQEVLSEAVRSIDHFEMNDETSLIRWLATIVENRIASKAKFLRADKRDADRELPIERNEDSRRMQLPARQPSPSMQLMSNERNDVVRECIAELPEHYRELILLRDYMGASWERAAEEANAKSAEAARVMHSRAVSRLGKLLRERGVE